MNKNWKVTIGSLKGKKFINVYFEGKRYRYWNGNAINLPVNASEEPEILEASFKLKLLNGWVPEVKKAIENIYVREVIEESVNRVLKSEYSIPYKKDCKRILKYWIEFENQTLKQRLKIDDLKLSHLERFICRAKWSLCTQKNTKATLSPLIKSIPNQISQIKIRKAKSSLNKPFKDIKSILGELEAYNRNLYLCCLFTYGCLLRPHREIRTLTWNDFTEDLSYIRLDGTRNKSGRNRIVPVPRFVREQLIIGDSNHSIFTASMTIPNPDYFKTLWSRFKKVSKILEQDQTLYSFRHSGAIEIYKRTNSLNKLQKAMGHSSLTVSLTYLKGLEVSELEEDDMPMI